MSLRPVVGLVLGLVVLSTAPVLAHHPAEQVDEQLIDAGNRLMYGGFDAAQPGPLVVVPHEPGPLECRLPGSEGYLLDAGPSAGVSFITNGTHLLAVLDLPAQGEHYAAVAVDSGEAVRTLLMMQEHLVSMHRFGAVVDTFEDGVVNRSVRWGTMGVPYAVPGTTTVNIEHDMPGDGILMDHDDHPRGGTYCSDGDAGHAGFLFDHKGPGEPLEPGGLVHVVTLFDAQVAAWLPRPVDDSTSIRQYNLYLAREGEDPEDVQRALSPEPGTDDLVPVGILVVVGTWAFFAGTSGRRKRG